MAFPPKKPAGKPSNGKSAASASKAPVKAKQPASKQAAPKAEEKGKAARTTSLVGPNTATPEPKLSPEAEAARAKQGAVQVTVVTGPAVAPPADPRASYQVGEAEDNTPLISFTTLASAASKKGTPAALLPQGQNEDMEEEGGEETDEAEEADVDEDEAEAPAEEGAKANKAKLQSRTVAAKGTKGAVVKKTGTVY